MRYVHNQGLGINVRLKRTPYIQNSRLILSYNLYAPYYTLLHITEYIFLILIIAEAIKLAILYTFIYSLSTFNIFQYWTCRIDIDIERSIFNTDGSPVGAATRANRGFGSLLYVLNSSTLMFLLSLYDFYISISLPI